MQGRPVVARGATVKAAAVIHVGLGAESWPSPRRASILDGLWWCEGAAGIEDGEFALVRAPGEFEALWIAIADYERQTGDRQSEDDWTVRPATAEQVIAWWRRVQYPSLDDPGGTDDDPDWHGACGYDACELNQDPGRDYVAAVLAQINGEDTRRKAPGQVRLFGGS